MYPHVIGSAAEIGLNWQPNPKLPRSNGSKMATALSHGIHGNCQGLFGGKGDIHPEETFPEETLCPCNRILLVILLMENQAALCRAAWPEVGHWLWQWTAVEQEHFSLLWYIGASRIS